MLPTKTQDRETEKWEEKKKKKKNPKPRPSKHIGKGSYGFTVFFEEFPVFFRI